MHAKNQGIGQTEPGLVNFYESGLEIEWVYSFNPGARTGQIMRWRVLDVEVGQKEPEGRRFERDGKRQLPLLLLRDYSRLVYPKKLYGACWCLLV